VGDIAMSENELLKQINRELKVTSMENSEKKSAKNKDETDDNDEKKSDDVLDDNVENTSNETSDDNEELSDEEKEIEKEREDLDNLNDVENDIEDIASEQTDEVKDELSDVVLSSAPQLLEPGDLPVERNEIDDPVDASGILKDYKIDKTSDFIDPNGNDSDNNQLKVVDTALGVFTILNSDDKNVLLLDSNKQKIQISIDDFNNLHPFEIKDDVLSDVNSFTDAFEKDLKIKKEKQKMDAEEEESDSEESDFGEEEDTSEEEPEETGKTLSDLGGFGESVKHRRRRVKKENKNLISEIQKGLSQKTGVVETIRSDVRGKNRCVLVAKQAKATKESRMNETRPKNSNSIINSYKFKNKDNSQNVLESKKKKEATQVSDIVQTPRGVFSDDDNFDLHNVVTIKDGKFVLVKLEGKYKTAYLKLLPKKKKNISINELKFILNDVDTFNESLKEINRGFTLIEKEIVAMKTKKYEAEEVEEIENDEELEEVEVDDEESEASEEVKDDSEDETEEEEAGEEEVILSEDQPDSVPFSVEINGVRYSGTLYAETDDESEEAEELEEDDDAEQNEDDDDYSDLILQSEDDVDDIDFPNGLDVDNEIIDADVELENVRYNVSFYDVKKECIKRAKLEMRKHNKVGAWNALVRGAGSIEC
jgi:hypothetical protein